VRRVRVGSGNGPKIAGVRAALAPFVDAVEVEGCKVSSGVPEQPVGLAQIARGARNRAQEALRTGPCDLGVGIEDGLVPFPELDGEVLNLGCAVLCDGERSSLGLSSGFAYPPACTEPALRGEPIGPLFDRWFAARRDEAPAAPSALSIGNVGKLTLGALSRSEYSRHAVLCALVRFLQPDLYFGAEAAP
jgi:inosine/xanthosine triphosphatase